MATQTFVFQPLHNEQDTDSRVVNINPTRLYTLETGYGFVTERNRVQGEFLQIPELNAGFFESKEETATTVIEWDEHGCFTQNEGMIPLVFKIDVQRLGNYEVTMTLYAEGEIKIFAGCRNLVFHETTASKQDVTCCFNLSLHGLIPNGKNCMYENRSIDVAIIGDFVRLKKIQYKKVNCPTLYIVGDGWTSQHAGTYPYHAKDTKSGWGQMMPCFMKKGLAVSNQSQTGLNAESFRHGGHFALVQAHMKLGDYFLLHFANREKAVDVEDYTSNIISYIEEVRAMGAYPILSTPISVGARDKQMPYVRACREIAQTYHVPLIDLHDLWKAFLKNNRMVDYLVDDSYEFLNENGARVISHLFIDAYKQQVQELRPDAYTRLAKLMVG